MTMAIAAAGPLRDEARVCLQLRFYTKFRINPHIDLEPDYIIRKPLLHSILRYIPRREILSTFHTRVENRSVP